MNSSGNDCFYSEEQFQAFFARSSHSLILKADLPHFKVLAVSNTYLELTHKQRSDVLSKGLFQVFPGNGADPSEQYSVFNSFKRVIDTKEEDNLPVFKYEIFVPDTGKLETQYWSNLNEPILNAEGNVAYIINTTTNITERILNQHAAQKAILLEEALDREQVLNEELAIANEELHAINEELQESQHSLALLNFELEERVSTRTKALAESEAMMSSAIASAKLGTWFINTATREFVTSARTNELFGYYPHEAVTFEAVIKQISEDYRDLVFSAVEEAIRQNGSYEMEYPIIGFHDGKLRWVRATGKTYQAKAEQASHFSGTIIDITEHKMDDIRKNDFIAMVSHELKTPLTSLKANVQMLAIRAKKAEDTFAMVALDKVNRQVKTMTTMINSFLNVSQLESGKIHLDKAIFNLEDLVKDRVEEISSINQSHAIIFMPCKNLPVYADEEKIAQVINNLLSNAVKYSPKGKKITISCNHLNGMAQVRVRDEGVGVHPQDTTRIFERFYRVKSYQTQTVSGFGIGLYLCSEIMQRHQGKIAVDSEPGHGSTFYFSLPLVEV